MRSSVKKQLIEMVEYIDFPMGVYVYETGKVIAANRLAKAVLNGTSCQNANLLWPDRKKFKLPAELLSGGSQLFFEQKVMVGEELRAVDFELNVLPLPNEHIIVAFFDESIKQPFRMDVSKLLPGLIWKDANKENVSVSIGLKFGMSHYAYMLEHPEQATETELEMMKEIERQQNAVYEKKEPVFCQVEQVDFTKENTGLVSMNKLPIIGKGEELLGVLMICKPVLSEEDYKQLYASQSMENTLLRECVMLERKMILCVGKQEEMNIRYATSNFCLLGYPMEDVIQRKVNWTDVIDPEDRERVKEEIREAFERKERFFYQKYRIVDAKGEKHWINTMNTGRGFQSGEEYMRIVIEIDSIASQNMLYDSVMTKKETYLDFLTGLPNRLKYETDAAKLIEAAIESRKKGYIFALDLDDFRHINEGLGPEYGDILLNKISKELNDIPEIENYCYRVDGDEFLIFVRSEYEKKVEEIIQKCLALFQSSWKLQDKECFCTVSIGIAEYPKDSAHPRELLKYADAAVYEAKRKGKNRIQHYKRAVLQPSMDRVNYEKYLRKAIAKGCVEFEMFFQLIVRAQTKEYVSAEALVRWYSPELGFISPINFISLSEYLGLIVPLGEYVLRQTFATCKRWNDTYNPDFKVSVNLSVIQLVQPNIVERILEIARATGVNKENIILEVTESLAVEDMSLMKTVLTELRSYGFSIALDDFGTGYSSLNHIMEMPLNYVKIDKSFVSTYGTKDFNPSLLSAIAELAHSVNMEIIVEGVETKQQMEFLMFLNTDKIQGYLYGKPMPATEFEKRFFK